MQSDDAPIGEFFQIAYVTSDLERGIETFKTFGMPEFQVVKTRDFPNPGKPNLRLAMAYRGPVMIELVEPEADSLDLYKDALRSDGGLNIHHLGYFVTPEEFETLEARLHAKGIATPDIRRHGYYDILFADTRKETGLYSEYIAVPKEKWPRFGGRSIPRF
jgi:hypothetical protein